MPEELVLFEDFVFDRSAYELRRSGTVVSLQRIPFELLSLLIERRGKLVTREEILERVWGKGVFVDTENAINTAVLKLRRALGDDPEAPRFVLTVPAKGYRFIAVVERAAQEDGELAESRRELVNHRDEIPAPLVVGREEELARLRGYFARASEGIRQIVFVTGEAGIGKTTIIRAFLADLVSDGKVRIGHGQCVEQYGSGEPYMPLLEALMRLCQETGGEGVREILSRVAPSWLAQMPTLLTDTERERLQNVTQGMTQQRMLREMAGALEALTAEVPMVLAFEDLHWSDFSTLELIAAVARRSATARLLIIATYRPVEVLANEHPLRGVKEELQLHRQCWELKLGLLNENDVAAYLSKRFAEHESYAQIATTIHQRTEGNPLFMVNIVDYLVETGGLINSKGIEAPPTIQELIERNLERLDTDEQQILEAASVAGAVFSAAAVAAALKRPVIDIETCCSRLARREQFINPNGAANWPDGTVAASFRFHHGLYEQVLYNRIPAGWRVDLHRRIAERAERAFGDRVCEIAAELAHHYGRVNEPLQAIKYLQIAGEQAVQRVANREAVAHFRAALDIVDSLPHDAERSRLALGLCIKLRDPLIVVEGYTSSEVEEICRRARELCQQIEDGPELFGALAGLNTVYFNRAKLRIAIELADQMLALADRLDRRSFRLWAHYAMAFSLSGQGNHHLARKHLEQCLDLYDPQRAGHYGFVQDPGPTALIRLAQNLNQLGYLDLAMTKALKGLRLAHELSDPFTLAWSLHSWGVGLLNRGDFRGGADLLERAIELCGKHGFDSIRGDSVLTQGWVQARFGQLEQGIARIREGIAIQQRHGASSIELALLADVLGMTDRLQEGLSLIDEALTQIGEWSTNLPWLMRIKGDLLLKQQALSEAESCFLDSITVARTQANKLQELVAATHVARLFKSQGRLDEARVTLAGVYGWFTEGLDTAYLKDAKALLDELSA